MPSSLTRVLSRALEYSSHPPESVCSTDSKVAQYAAFLGSLESPSFSAEAEPHHLSELMNGRLSLTGPSHSSYGLEHGSNTVLGLSFSVPAYVNAISQSAGILTCCPSPTPLGLGLGSDSPMGGLSFPRKPWVYGDRISHPVYRYSCLHKLFSGPVVLLTVHRVSTREYSSTALRLLVSP